MESWLREFICEASDFPTSWLSLARPSFYSSLTGRSNPSSTACMAQRLAIDRDSLPSGGSGSLTSQLWLPTRPSAHA
jgi:hypothetical protein